MGAAADTIRTARLDLCPLARTDVEPLHALWTTAGVRRHLWDDEIITPDRTSAVVEESRRLFAASGHGLWGARQKGRRQLVGFGGYWYFREPPELELLYGVAETHWGRGYATEIARALVEHGASTLRFTEIRASTDAPNAASIRVLEKLGFEPAGRAVVNGLDTRFFSLPVSDRTAMTPHRRGS